MMPAEEIYFDRFKNFCQVEIVNSPNLVNIGVMEILYFM